MYYKTKLCLKHLPTLTHNAAATATIAGNQVLSFDAGGGGVILNGLLVFEIIL